MLHTPQEIFSLFYAGIGSRKLSKEELNVCYLMGVHFSMLGYTLRTGAAQGADQAFANGALDNCSKMGEGQGGVVLCLPWPNYEKYWVDWARNKGAEILVVSDGDAEAVESVYKYHPKPHGLSRGPLALHARNYRIVKGCNFVMAWPKPNKFGALGGTGQGIRVAEGLGTKVHNLNNQEECLDALRHISKEQQCLDLK